MKKSLIFLTVFLFSLVIVTATGDHDFKEAEELIEQKIPCSQLTEEQLEHIGDYYMEQMHPGEAHETMDEMMGGEGSESLKQMHVNIARSFYCGEHDAMSSGMMDMMMGRSNMMNSGGMIGAGMMGNFGYGIGYWNFANILYIILLIGLIILVYLWIIKLLKNTKNKGSRK